MRFALAGFGLVVLAACSAPVKSILPGQVDLLLAVGDRMRFCTDDGVEDTTPMSDCVIMDARSHPIAPYVDELKAKGWTQAEADPDGVREVWTLAREAGAAEATCKRLVVDAGREKMSRKGSMIVRFDVSEGPCAG